MGAIHSGSQTYTRYRVVGGPATQEQLLMALQEYAFQEPLTKAKKGETYGWVSAQNLTDRDFTSEKVVFGAYAAFALRTDEKKLPVQLFKALLDNEYREWMKSHDRDRTPAPVKKEIRELLELKLLPQHLPKATSVDVLWDRQRNEVLVYSQSAKVVDRFRKFFVTSFQCLLHRMDPVRVGLLVEEAMEAPEYLASMDQALEAPLFGEDGEGTGEPFFDGGGGPMATEAALSEHPANSVLCVEFLAWLWHRCEHDKGMFTLPGQGEVKVWLDDAVSLAPVDSPHLRVSWKGGHPTATQAAHAALKEQRAPYSLTLGVSIGEREYRMKIKAPSLTPHSLKLPSITKGSESALYERSFLREEVQHALDGVFGIFLGTRLHDSWPTLRGYIRDWMAAEVGVVPEEAGTHEDLVSVVKALDGIQGADEDLLLGAIRCVSKGDTAQAFTLMVGASSGSREALTFILSHMESERGQRLLRRVGQLKPAFRDEDISF